MTAPSSTPSFPSPPARAANWVKGTAGKSFIIMMLALLPLAVATIISNSYSIGIAEQEKQAMLAAATRQNAAQLSSTINAIHTAQSLTANVMAQDGMDQEICHRLQIFFTASTVGGGLPFALFHRDGRVFCESQGGAARLRPLLQRAKKGQAEEPDILLMPEQQGLLIRARSRDDQVQALALYLRPELQQLGRDESAGPDQAVILHQGQRRLVLTGDTEPLALAPDARWNGARASAPLMHDSAVSGLVLEARLPYHLSTGAQMFSLFMPLLLWLAAVLLGWLVMRWLLIKPLVALRREVAAYTPGDILHPPHISPLASSEIIDLGESFEKMSRQVATHEEGMQAALERQTRLTREVHHRVKNNLQVISSLISLHWRAADDPQAAHAYLSIQRRVDALAVVQRNHYADANEDIGLRARPMMNEIASGLKISARVQSDKNVDIAVDCDDVTLHQDTATAIAFMTAELADLFISLDSGGRFTISLLRVEGEENRARLALSAPLFRTTACLSGDDCSRAQETVTLYEKVLEGLARQLRSPLGHDVEQGEYHVIVPITG